MNAGTYDIVIGEVFPMTDNTTNISLTAVTGQVTYDTITNGGFRLLPASGWNPVIGTGYAVQFLTSTMNLIDTPAMNYPIHTSAMTAKHNRYMMDAQGYNGPRAGTADP